MAWSLPEQGVLGILGARSGPGVGAVDPSLAQEFGSHAAGELHEAMLFDLLETWNSEDILAPGGRRVLVFGPADAGPWFDVRVPASFAMQHQTEGDPGARIQWFFEGEFEAGASRVVLIGAEAPTLDPTLVISAFLCLESRDVVLGPTTAGGYYLVGSRGSVAPIFEGIEWDSPLVLSQTIDRLRDTGRSLAVLPPWYDVRTPADVRVLIGHLRAMRRAGMNPRLPRVESLLGLGPD